MLAIVLMATGCNGSRWARSDPKYAQKYDHHTDDPVRTVKQAIDARHLEGRGGYYADVASQDDPAAIGVGAGYFSYAPKAKGMLEARGGLSLLAGENGVGVTGGGELGARIQLPTRLAPFVGGGLYAGYLPDINEISLGGSMSGPSDEDNDDLLVAAAYPEAGIHFWMSPTWRLTASVSHYFPIASTRGTSDDAEEVTMFRVGLARLNIPSLMGRGHYQRSMPPIEDFVAYTEEMQTLAGQESPAPPSTPWFPPPVEVSHTTKESL